MVKSLHKKKSGRNYYYYYFFFPLKVPGLSHNPDHEDAASIYVHMYTALHLASKVSCEYSLTHFRKNYLD